MPKWEPPGRRDDPDAAWSTGLGGDWAKDTCNVRLMWPLRAVDAHHAYLREQMPEIAMEGRGPSARRTAIQYPATTVAFGCFVMSAALPVRRSRIVEVSLSPETLR